MAFVQNGEVHYGPDAINAIALMSTGSNWFNRLTSALFASRGTARLLYPAMRFGRAVALKLLGRRKIA